MGRKKKKRSSDQKPLLKNAIYATKGAGMKKRRHKGDGLAATSKAAGAAIKKAQKEAEILALMKDKKLTYAQAAIELMG